MFKVITFFTDKQDNNYAYHAGDTFPRDGLVVSAERLAELASDQNRRGKVLIVKEESPEKVAEEKPKKKRGRPRHDAE